MSDTEGPDDEPTLIGGRSMELDPKTTAAILPSAIHHLVDELRADRELIEHYNYFVYYFDRAGHSCTARTYVATIDEVALLGSATDQGKVRRVPNSPFRNDVLQYLKRRFHHITELGDEGYETVWRSSNSPTSI